MLIFAVTSLWRKYVLLFPLCSCIIEIQMVCYLFYLFAFKGRYTRKNLFSYLFKSMGISRNQTAGSWTQGLWSLQWFFFNVMSTQIDFVNFTHKKVWFFILKYVHILPQGAPELLHLSVKSEIFLDMPNISRFAPFTLQF